MDKRCMYCNDCVSTGYEYYLVRIQRAKFQKRETIGYACDECVEGKDCKVEYKLWLGESPPKRACNA